MNRPEQILEQLLIGAVYGELSTSEREQHESLLGSEPAYKHEYERLRQVAQMLDESANELLIREFAVIDPLLDEQWQGLQAMMREVNVAEPLVEAHKLNPYSPIQGASELKAFIPHSTRRGFASALAAMMLLMMGYKAVLKMQENAVVLGAKVNVMKLTQLPPPLQEATVPPPPITTTGPAARAGTPVPVPDALVTPDMKDFANVDEVSRASTTGGDGQDRGFLGLAKDVEVEVREDEPSAYDFVPVEKEPYIDIRELQKKVVYPELAKRASIEGKVNIRVLVGKNGVPKKSLIESTDSELLNDAATRAVMNAVFTPAIQNNQPIDCWVSIPIVFRLR
jgi:protein TonB